MLFNSLHFILFFAVVVTIYFAIPRHTRLMFLLGASYYFYMCWNPKYLILIVISTLVNYCAAIGMANTHSVRLRKSYLISSIALNLGMLLLFKYYNFFIDSFEKVANELSIGVDLPYLHVLLPVGISFYTFQAMGYTIDVYNGNQKPESHVGRFALYVSFFPQLVAGPIERSGRLLPQFYQNHPFRYDQVKTGLKRMAWGFFKKMVIADRLAIYVDQVYNHPAEFYGFPVILATIFFAFQIYCDFSGYSDIAIGAAKVLGYDLMENFNAPYWANSIGDFWKRWHISLSTWFRDYLYIPLGGNRFGITRMYENLFLTFMVSGLWHGANWTFVLWGALHGFYVIVGHYSKKIHY